MNLFDLSGRVAVVTGGNGGIGLGMAEGLARAGAAIVVAARNPQKSAAALERLAGTGSQAIAIATDVTDEKSVAALVAETEARLGRLDILINNAGMNVRGRPEDLSLADWNRVIATNLTGAQALSQAAYPAFRRAGGGKIINIGSMYSLFGAEYVPAYAASKGGIVQLTKAHAAAWAKDNIQVNAVLPGWIDTDLTRGAREQVPGLNERVVGRTPLGRWGEIEDMAGIAVFLASAASDFVTGTAIPVDGGYAMHG